MHNIKPISGWSLDYIVALDAHRAGTAGDFLRASVERRQVIAALLSTKPLPNDPGKAASLAAITSNGGHREMLRIAYGSAPTGIRGALARSGPQPHPRAFYRMLADLLRDSGNAPTARVIKQLDALDLLRLRIIQSLPADICTANLVRLIGNTQTASDVAKLIDLMTEGGIDRREISQALGRVTTDTQLSEFWDRWTQKLPLPEHPVPETANYQPIKCGAELRRMALRYRNCARRYLPQALEGRDAFAEYAEGGNRAVVHLEKREDGWALAGTFGQDNGRIEPALRIAAHSYLTANGVNTTTVPMERGGDWAVLRRLSGVHTFGF